MALVRGKKALARGKKALATRKKALARGQKALARGKKPKKCTHCGRATTCLVQTITTETETQIPAYYGQPGLKRIGKIR